MIWVDGLKPCVRTPTWRHLKSCHLFCDGDLQELHQFAARLGLKREWFQDHASLPHYDLTERKRQRAILLGAASVGSDKTVKQMEMHHRDTEDTEYGNRT